MKARPKLTDAQQAKAIAMATDGATHAEIAALLHVPLGTIRTVLTGWIKANLPELQKHLRAFIDSSLANGKQSMILPKVSRLVSRPVLADYATRYTITTRGRMGCTWHQFTALAAKPKTRPSHMTGLAREHIAAGLKAANIGDAIRQGKCVKCGTNQQMPRRKKCANCCAEIRRLNRGSLCK